MYPNLNAEMARRKMTQRELAEKSGIPYGSLVSKIRGEKPMKMIDAMKIKSAICNDLTLEYLFETAEGQQ